MHFISHVPALIVWLCCCVEKDSMDIPGLSERVKGLGSKTCHRHQIGYMLAGRGQHTWEAFADFVPGPGLMSPLPPIAMEIYLHLQVKLTFLF